MNLSRKNMFVASMAIIALAGAVGNIGCSDDNNKTSCETGAGMTDTKKNIVNAEEEIWALEEAYFARLYKADYAAMLSLVHSQFLGWPGNVPHPLDKEGSERFMKQLVPAPTPYTFKIERQGIRLAGQTALTQYVIRVDNGQTGPAAKTQSSRITHTWVKESAGWKLLGGMSMNCD